MSNHVAKTPPPINLPCQKYWTSLRSECKKCKDKMKCPMYLTYWKKHQKLMRWKRQQKRFAKIVSAVKIFILAKIRLDFFGIRKSASNHRNFKFHVFTLLGSWNENDEPLNLRHTRVTTVAHFHDVCFIFFSNLDRCLRADAWSCTISSSTSVTRSGSPPRIYQSEQSREKVKHT